MPRRLTLCVRLGEAVTDTYQEILWSIAEFGAHKLGADIVPRGSIAHGLIPIFLNTHNAEEITEAAYTLWGATGQTVFTEAGFCRVWVEPRYIAVMKHILRNNGLLTEGE